MSVVIPCLVLACPVPWMLTPVPQPFPRPDLPQKKFALAPLARSKNAALYIPKNKQIQSTAGAIYDLPLDQSNYKCAL